MMSQEGLTKARLHRIVKVIRVRHRKSGADRSLLIRQQSFFWTTLKMVIVAAFVVAGGSFSHSFADTTHEHLHQTASGGGHTHDHASNQPDHQVADHETVHCGAYLLALTHNEHLSLPDLVDETIGDAAVSTLSRASKVEPPPPRRTPLSV
jgi:hypothetical protein